MTDTDQQSSSDNTNENTAWKNGTPRRLKRAMTGMIITLVIISIALLLWMYLPVVQEFISGTPTATMLPPTPSPTPTHTATSTRTASPPPPPTATPMPPSAYQIQSDQIYPEIPGLALSAVVLNEDLNVTIDPAFDHPQWYSSEQISQQIGMVISEPFFATIGPGSALWSMDVPLQPGLYEIYILDTSNSSGGSLDFHVFLGQREIFPLLGIQRVEYNTLSSSPPQAYDEWASIGLYQIDTIDLLTIGTVWEAREMASIVAIDRVLIAQQPDSIQNFISLLPLNSPKFVVDDSAALVNSRATWFTRNDRPAWGDEFQMVVNPEANSQVTWQIPGRVPPGQYDIWIWAPEMQGDVEVVFEVLVNGLEHQGVLVASTGNMPDNQWISLGTWQASSPDGKYIQLALRLDIAEGILGEVAIDTAAFIFRQ